MGIARAGQIAGRRGHPNDIRDNEQRKAGISRDGNRRKSKTESNEAGNRGERDNRRAHVKRVARQS